MTCSTLDCALETSFRLIIWILFLWMDQWTPFIRYIDEDEMWQYRYPSMHSYVPKSLLYLIMWAVPTSFFLGLYLVKKNDKTLADIKQQVYGLTLAYSITATFTTILKMSLGRPRPNFYYRCFPDGYGTNIEGCTGAYDGHMDGRKSFPSGHAAFSFTGMVYLTLFIFKVVDFSRPFLARGPAFCLCTVPVLMATMIAVSRTCDYHHHYSDVIGGGLMGTGIAVLVYYYFGYPDPKEEPNELKPNKK